VRAECTSPFALGSASAEANGHRRLSRSFALPILVLSKPISGFPGGRASVRAECLRWYALSHASAEAEVPRRLSRSFALPILVPSKANSNLPGGRVWRGQKLVMTSSDSNLGTAHSRHTDTLHTDTQRAPGRRDTAH
jgi:hypothetical protein